MLSFYNIYATTKYPVSNNRKENAYVNFMALRERGGAVA